MNYQSLITSHSTLPDQAQAQAANAINRLLVLRNWAIGCYLVEFEQNGLDRSPYGENRYSRLANDLRRQGWQVLDVRSRERSRLFYRLYPQLTSAISGSLTPTLHNLLPERRLENPASLPPFSHSDAGQMNFYLNYFK